MKDAKNSLYSLFVGTLASITVWLSILITVDPARADVITKIAFFASMFLGLAGTLSFFIIYLLSSSRLNISKVISNSISHASLFALAIVLILVLQTIKVLGLWEMIIIVLLVVLTEFFMYSRKGIRTNE